MPAAAIAKTIDAKARPISTPERVEDFAGAAGREETGLALAAGAATAGAACCLAATGAAGAAEWRLSPAVAATGAEVAIGTRIDGPPVGLGGRLMRTVCFFCETSAAVGGSGVSEGGTGGVVSDIA